MQKVQRWSQPFCTCTNTRGRPVLKPSSRCGAISRTAMMSATAIFSLVSTPKPASNAARASRQASPRILSSLPTTRSTSAISANISGWVCAAQPVTTMRTCGRSRFSRRIDCRACATASLVTAQLLMTTVSESPARSASRAITSDSKALRRQPKVRTSTLMALRRRWRTAPDRSGLHIRNRRCRSSAHGRRARAIRSQACRRAA